MRFRFRDCVLDDDLFELRRGGEPVEVQPKVLSVLLFLLQNRDRTVTKDEILDAVWPNTATGEGSLTRAVSFARTALGEQSAETIRTVRGRGYRIGVPVTEDPLPEEAVDSAPTSDFVCREKELGLARDALLQAISGRGQVLLLAGEQGIGKTRMAEEVAALADRRGARVYWGRCYEGEGGPAFWPWVQVLRGYLRDHGCDELYAHVGAGAAEVAEIVPEIREHLPELPRPDTGGSEQARFGLFDALTRLLRAASRERPLALILDDLQNADEPSLRLLQFLARDLRESPLLLLGTYRDAEHTPGHPLDRTLAELLRSPHPKRTIFLRGLTQSCVRRFTQRIAGIDPSEELVDALYRRTEGNPLFLVELLQWLQTHENPWEERESWDKEIPEGVRQVIGRRLEGLSDGCHRALASASVIGRDFSLSVLARACQLSEGDLLGRLEEAERARIVESTRAGPERFRFTHTLIAETLYDQLGTSARLREHRAIAQALEAFYTPKPLVKTNLAIGIGGSHLAELAYHFCEAAVGGDAHKAVDYAMRAARHAMTALAFEEAERYCARALRVLDSCGDLDELPRCRLLLALGEAQYRSGEPEASKRSLELAIESARATGDVESLAKAAIRLHRQADVGGNVFLGRGRGRIGVLEESLAALGEENAALRARLMASLSNELFFQGEEERSQRLSTQALDTAKHVGDPATLWNVLHGRKLYMLDPRDDEGRRSLVGEVLALARETGDRPREFLARLDFALSHAIEIGDRQGSDRELGVCVQLADELRQPFFHWMVTRALAARALWQGCFEEAESLLSEARTHGRRAGEIADLSYHTGLLSLRRMQGRFGELESALRADHRLPMGLGHKSSALALLYGETGRAAESRVAFERLAADGFSAVRRDSNYAYNLALLSETCVLLEAQQSSAEELYSILLPYSGRTLMVPTIVVAGCASRHLGLLAMLLRRWEDAEGHFEDALEVESRMNARPFEAYVLRDYARMLTQRGEPGDRAAAGERLSRAHEIAHEIGLAGLEA